jgi:hypothetical protein
LTPTQRFRFQGEDPPHPDGVLGMIDDDVAGLRVQEHRQAKTVEHEPVNDRGEETRGEGDLDMARVCGPTGPSCQRPIRASGSCVAIRSPITVARSGS